MLPFALVFAATPSVAFAQSPVCHPIRAGESALQVARRVTGNSRNAYQPWFQIMDPASRFVPKSQYDRVRRGWRACIVKEAGSSVQVARASQREVLPVAAPPVNARQAAAADIVHPLATADLALERIANALRPLGIDLTAVWLAAVLIVPLFAWKVLDNFTTRRNAKVVVMKHFAHRFVSEFERPLRQEPAEHPLRAQLRLSPTRARMDILLAPGVGRRYPNLSDHKKNVEYDVVRIQRALADEAFVRDPLYMHAGWVVVPFRFKVRGKRTGVA